MAADAAMMNPDAQILALKAGVNLQVFNLATKQKLKACVLNDEVKFWRWITPDTIGIVTTNAVMHWVMDANVEAPPTKIFDLNPQIIPTQIINYRMDAKGQWCLLIGIAPVDNRIAGTMQLYSMEKKASQVFEGHTGAFTQFGDATLLVFANRNPQMSKLTIIEVGGATFGKKQSDIVFPADAAADFPVSMAISDKYKLVYLITKMGYFHMFDLETGTMIYMNRISAETIFVTAIHRASGGMMGVNRKGQVLLVTPDDNTIVNYITSQLGNQALAISLAGRAGLPGCENLFQGQFEQFFQSGQYKEAALVAAKAGNAMRNANTIQRFQQAQGQPGQPSPLLQYFVALLEVGKLNKIESIELARPVLEQQRLPLLQKWIQEQKLEPSEELGDLLKPHDAQLALSIYLQGNSPQKVIQCFAETGAYDKIVLYAKKVGYTADYMQILTSVIRSNPQAALQFALSLAQNDPPLVDFNVVVDAFMQFKLLQEATSFLLDVLKGNKPSEGKLQTRLLEMNLMAAPQVADAILGNDMFSHYDRAVVAKLCERVGLFQRALEHYADINDIKRVIVNTQAINPEALVNFFGTLSAENSLLCLGELLRVNPRGNLQVVVAVCSKYSEQLTPAAIIAMFEKFGNFEGLYFYLGAMVNQSQDGEIHFRYIQAAAKVGQIKEVERLCKESTAFDPKKVCEFLKSAKLPDQLPLIIVCDRFDMVDDLTAYLYSNGMTKFIEIYVQKINPLKTPIVVGALLDRDGGEDFIRNLIMSVRNMCPVEPLVAEVEKRNRLRIIGPWLEARLAEGNTEVATHNALAKIAVDTNNNAELFLKDNIYYDSKVVGAYCEKRDPHLAFLAYKRGACDYELIEVCNKNGLFKQQARYLVERQDMDLWAAVLNPENEFRRQIIDSVVQVALPEAKSADQVSTAVKAFMTADLPNELIELLEKIVLETSAFSDNKNLQNLLILTAIKADKTRVLEYINRLDNYDAPDIANIAIGAELFEEAYVIFQKYKMNLEAINVLIGNMHNIERALEFANRVDNNECWVRLAAAQLDENLVSEAISSYMRASDASNFQMVIKVAEREGKFEDLVKYLQMARKKVKEGVIETELIYAFAKTNNLADLEEFVSGPNIAEIQGVGDRCFDEGLYQAAKFLYTSISNFGRLASALVHLKEYQAAVDAAKKANSTRTWKEVNKACVEGKEFKLAHTAGLHIIVQPDELEEIVFHYEERGYFAEIIALLEAGLTLEAVHTGIFTELGVLYTKHRPEKVSEHIKLYWQKCRINKLTRACEASRLWKELCFLYVHNEEFDNACMCMIDHSAESWDHVQFKDVCNKVSNMDIFYRGIQFYLNEQPLLLVDLLSTISARLEHGRVVQMMRRAFALPLIKPYLQAVQRENNAAVNEALNELLIEECDYAALRTSITAYENFNSMQMAQTLENNEMLEFRRIAAILYKQNKRYQQSVDLSKKDKLYHDAMQTAAASNDKALVDSLLKFFVVEKKDKECFAAMLYTCYDLIALDVALEMAWRANMIDAAFPYFINVAKEYTTKVDTMVKEWEAAKEKEKQKEKDMAHSAGDHDINPLAITIVPQMGGVDMGGMGMGMGGGMGYDGGYQQGGFQQGGFQQGGFQQGFGGGYGGQY